MSALQLFDPHDTGGVTLSDIYRKLEPELSPDMSPRSKVEHRTSLKHWVQATGDPPLRLVDRETVRQLRDHLIGIPVAPATINKIWRTLRSFMRFAADEMHERFATEGIPSLHYRSRSKLVSEPVPMQRERITHEELATIWRGCLQANYPRVEPVLAWRTFIVLLWSYGMRSGDLVNLPRTAILWQDGLLRFAADKTGKLQGLPLTDVVRWHLTRWLEVAPPGQRLFEGFNRTGHQVKKTGEWTPGYYSSWRSRIAADIDPPILFQNFRQTMVTEMNDLGHGSDIGGWVAGHSQTSVTGRHYDTPSQRIRKAFAERPVPPCFLWGMSGES